MNNCEILPSGYVNTLSRIDSTNCTHYVIKIKIKLKIITKN